MPTGNFQLHLPEEFEDRRCCLAQFIGCKIGDRAKASDKMPALLVLAEPDHQRWAVFGQEGGQIKVSDPSPFLWNYHQF